MTTTDIEYRALRKLVMKGPGSKAAAREALDELGELIQALESVRDELEEGVCNWEDGDDADMRREGKEQVEQAATDLDSPLTDAGAACGMRPFEPEDPATAAALRADEDES